MLVVVVGMSPAVGLTGASFTAQSTAATDVAETAALGPLTGLTAERDAAGVATVTWDAPVRPDVATTYTVERTLDGETTVVDLDGDTTGMPPLSVTATPVSSISVSNWASCAIAEGAVYCWGSELFGEYDVPSPPVVEPSPVRIGGLLEQLTVTEVSVGGHHACAVAEGSAYCWGAGGSGELGDGAMAGSSTPVKVGGVLAGKTVTSVSAGGDHSCAVADARAYCWGSGWLGGLGNGSTANQASPVAVGGLLAAADVTAISADSASCAIADGQAYCWGSNSGGMLGDGGTADSSTPVAVSTAGVLAGRTVTAIEASDRHVCALADARAFCWGDNANGQLGDGTGTTSRVPVAVDTSGVLAGVEVTGLSVGYRGACVVADGAGYCWGENGFRQLGDGTTTDRRSPVPLSSVSGVVTAVAPGQTHSCALVAGAVLCWGSGGDGKLGNGSTASATVPTAIDAGGALAMAVCEPGWRPLRDPLRCSPPLGGAGAVILDDLRVPGSLRQATQLSIGDSHSCAVASGLAVCWGANDSGQLGDGTTVTRSTPVAVTGALLGHTVTVVRASQSHSCALAEGTVYCWGYGGSGRLGNGATQSSATPVVVGGSLTGKTVTDLAVGAAQSCAVADGVAYCWGSREGGALGDGSTSGESPDPVAVGGLLTGQIVTRVATTRQLGCAIAHPSAAPLSTSVYCWGSGAQGRLGNGSTASSAVPVAVTMTGVLAGRTVTDIDADDGFNVNEATVCVIADADPFCWGTGTSGQLGNGSTTFSSVPVAVQTGPAISPGTTTAISTGYRTSCAVADGMPFCWGAEAGGGSSVPVAIDTAGVLTGMVASDIDFGPEHGCLIADDALYCWGGLTGRPLLGNGTDDTSAVLVPVDTSGVLGAGGCSTGWVASDLTRCTPGPGITVSYRVRYEKAGWSAPAALTSAVWVEETP
jgi:alpha-tubulin suppressor-like RCC1 family protein